MRSNHIVSTIFVLLLFFVSGNAQESLLENDITKEQKALIHEKALAFPNHTEIALAIIEHGAVSFYGIKKETDSVIYAENHTKVFEIGSISKVFTATLLTNYIISGRVKPDDNINDYLSIKLNNDVRITFEQLANHTSGLPRMPEGFIKKAIFNLDNPYKNYDEKELIKYMTRKLTLVHEQGKESMYSNLGAGILGYTICNIAGRDYEFLLDSMIFSKYGMTSSTTNRDKMMDKLVKGLNAKGKETSNWDLAALVGAGGILSNVEDLSKFAIAQFDSSNKELELTRIKTHFDSNGLDVGLGWHIVKSKTGKEWHWHNGGTGGYRSSMAIDADNQNGIIILSNVSAYHSKSSEIDVLCFELMKILKQK